MRLIFCMTTSSIKGVNGWLVLDAPSFGRAVRAAQLGSTVVFEVVRAVGGAGTVDSAALLKRGAADFSSSPQPLVNVGAREVSGRLISFESTGTGSVNRYCPGAGGQLSVRPVPPNHTVYTARPLKVGQAGR